MAETNSGTRHWTTDSRGGKTKSSKQKEGSEEPLKIKPVEFLGHTVSVPG